MAMKASAAIAHSSLFFSAREPMRQAANTTMATTAGLMPLNTPCTNVHVAESQIDIGQRRQNEQRSGSTNSTPGDDAAPGAMQQPADVDGELLASGPGSTMQ